MTASANGKDVLTATVTEAVTGNWSAQLELDSDEALPVSGRVTLDIDGVVWLGTLQRGELEAGRFHAVVVGGNGKLGQVLPAKHYLRGVTSTHLQEALGAGGEKLSADTDASVSSRATARYSRRRSTIGAAVAQIARESKANWRTQRDGSIWLGEDRWPASSSTSSTSTEHDELSRAPGKVTLAVESPVLAPGLTFEGRKIISVVTHVTSDSLTQELTFADDAAGGTVDRMKRMLGGIVEAMFGHRMDFGAWYPSVVVSQLSDNTVDLYPDDELMRGAGIARVPLRHGLPGCTVKVKPGARIILFYEDCDPSKPAAALWPDGSSVLSIAIDADLALTLKAPNVIVEGNLTVSGTVSASDVVVPAYQPIPPPPIPIAPISLKTHVHAQAAPGAPSPPIPMPA